MHSCTRNFLLVLPIIYLRNNASRLSASTEAISGLHGPAFPLGRRAPARPHLDAIRVGRNGPRFGARRRAAQGRQAAVAVGARGRVGIRHGRATLNVTTTHIVRNNFVLVGRGLGNDLVLHSNNRLIDGVLVVHSGDLVQTGRGLRRRIHGHDKSPMVEEHNVQEQDGNGLNRELHVGPLLFEICANQKSLRTTKCSRRGMGSLRRRDVCCAMHVLPQIETCCHVTSNRDVPCCISGMAREVSGSIETCIGMSFREHVDGGPSQRKYAPTHKHLRFR
jgi:hypothetical protein